MQPFLERPFVSPMIALGASILLAALVFSFSFYSARSEQGSISVTGSARELVRADLAKWTISVTHAAFADGQQAAYAQVERDTVGVKRYFENAGIPAASTTVSTIVADQDWSYQNNGGPVRYNVHQEITISSQDVDLVARLANEVTTLINQGYSISPRQPEYYVTSLPELRVALLGEAVADARARAVEIAKSGKTSVGALQSASSGVVQVLAPNATNVEDYGSYDTSSIDKEVSVTARASFFVR